MKIFKAEPSLHHRFDDAQRGLLDRMFIRNEREKPDFNRRMFDEDFARIFRYAGRDEGVLFKISSTDEALTTRLLSNIETRYGPHPIDRTVRELVADIAQSLVSFGAAHFFLKDDTDSDDIHITSFASIGVVHLFGTHFQWVPKLTKRHWDRNEEQAPRELRILDSAKVLYFVMPKSLKRMLSAQNRILAVIDMHQFGVTEFQPQPTHENPHPTNYFDFSLWRDTQERALYRSTRGTGWNGRKYDSSKCSDFFDCHRLIRFRRNQLILRDSILSQLVAQLSMAGRSYNSKYSVAISATDVLPSIVHLDELEAKLIREEVGFMEIINYCLER